MGQPYPGVHRDHCQESVHFETTLRDGASNSPHDRPNAARQQRCITMLLMKFPHAAVTLSLALAVVAPVPSVFGQPAQIEPRDRLERAGHPERLEKPERLE